MTERLRNILENIVHWDTCPDDYREDIQAYLESEPPTATAKQRLDYQH